MNLQIVIKTLFLVSSRASINGTEPVGYTVGYQTALQAVAKLMGLNWEDCIKPMSESGQAEQSSKSDSAEIRN